MKDARRVSGFTLVEVLIACVLLGVGITASLSGYAALARTRGRFVQTERMRELAARKLDELSAVATEAELNGSGNFEEDGAPGIDWRAESQDGDQTDLTILTIVATDAAGREEKVTRLLYRAATPLAGAAQ